MSLFSSLVDSAGNCEDEEAPNGAGEASSAGGKELVKRSASSACVITRWDVKNGY